MDDPVYVVEDNVHFNGTLNKVVVLKEEDGVKTVLMWDKLNEGDKETFANFMTTVSDDIWGEFCAAKATNGAELCGLFPLKTFGKKPVVAPICAHHESNKYWDGKDWKFLDDDTVIGVNPVVEAVKVEPVVEAVKVEPVVEAVKVEPAVEAVKVEPAVEAVKVEPAVKPVVKPAPVK